VFAPVAPRGSDFVITSSSIDYPPTTLLLLWPWTVLPGSLRDASWLLLSQVLALAVIPVLVYRAIGRPSWTGLLLVGAALVTFLPIRQSASEGQLSVLLAALAVIALAAHERHRPVAGGMALGLAIALKLSPALLLPYFLWKRDYRLVLWSLVVVAGVLGLTLAVGWGPQWQPSLRIISATGAGSAFVANQSLNGFVLRACCPDLNGLPINSPPVVAAMAWRVSELALAGGLVLMLWRWRPVESLGLWLEYGIVLLALQVALPFAWFHHYAVGAILIVVVGRLVSLGRLGSGVMVSLGLAYLVVNLVAYPLNQFGRNLSADYIAGHAWVRFGSSVTLYCVLLTIAAALAAAHRLYGRTG
jgi:alpha-1,2-mannosyltransferase